MLLPCRFSSSLCISTTFKFSRFQDWGDENEEPIKDSNVGEGTSDSFRLLLQWWTICCINVVDVFLNSLSVSLRPSNLRRYIRNAQLDVHGPRLQDANTIVRFAITPDVMCHIQFLSEDSVNFLHLPFTQDSTWIFFHSDLPANHSNNLIFFLIFLQRRIMCHIELVDDSLTYLHLSCTQDNFLSFTVSNFTFS